MSYNISQEKNSHKEKNQVVDFRSDTVTQPTDGMRAAMANSKVGDDVYGDDPTVNELQEKVANLLGKEAGLFVTSGTQSNLCSMLAHCQRGEEIITGDKYHIYIDEAGGASVLGSIMMAPIKTLYDGSIKADEIEKTIKPDDPHCPISRLLSLENTVGGKVQNQKNINECVSRAKQFGLSTHMDGARLMNAALKLGVPAKIIVEKIDSVSLCISKGLGAPAGSILAGSKDFIRKAYRVRKIVGGGMRQAGILASAGIYALDNNVHRLDNDHQNAILLAKKLNKIDKISVNPEHVETNMVFIKIPIEAKDKIQKYCHDNEILINVESETIRLVTHLDISIEKIDFFVEKFRSFFS
ncbi:MAG: low-specificity L-threonine aldolase [Paracoccaceae bacterium]|nr:low-specificity L-threonine aldolase [Paracoccaceae bacterium]